MKSWREFEEEFKRKIASGGHYTAFVKSKKGNLWMCFENGKVGKGAYNGQQTPP